MSLIHFRGQAILPPLIEEFDSSSKLVSETNDACKVELEEDKLLSQPANKSLYFLLPGIKDIDVNSKSAHNLCSQEISGNRNEAFARSDMAHEGLDSKLSINIDHCNNNECMNREMTAPINNNLKIISVPEHKDSPVDSITSESASDIESGICSDSINAGNTQSVQSNSPQNDTNTEVLKQSGISTGYFDDYLSLLTNRSCYNLYGSMEKKSDDEKSPQGSDYSLADDVITTSKKTHKRTSSGGSDKSIRSVGSTYMDGYLGQLTDQSWIAYPTENNKLTKSHHREQQLEPTMQLSRSSTDSSILHHKIQFIEPDSFFTPAVHMIRSTSIPNQLSGDYNENHNIVAVSPVLQDNSVSTDDNRLIFDTEWDDSVFEESFKSLVSNARDLSVEERSINTVVTGVDYSLPKCNSDEQSNYIGSQVQEDNNNEVKFVTDMQEKIPYIMSDNANLEGEFKNQYDNENTVLGELSNCLQDSYVSDLMEETCLDAYVTANCSGNIDHLSDGCNPSNDLISHGDAEFVHQKMMEFLQSKHTKELDILRRKHEEEIQQLNNNFHKLSFEQMKELQSYVMKTDSMDNLLEIYNHLAEENPDVNVDSEVETGSGFMASSSSMPSFFLHDDKQNDFSITKSAELTNSERISKLFSPSCSPQSLSANVNTIFTQQPISQSGLADYQGDYGGIRIREFYHRDGPASLLSPIKEMSASEVLEAQLSYYKHLESGLDLVPAREKDVISLRIKYELTPSILYGICKFQAVVRGRRVRKLMMTEKVKQILSTLLEVSKLANQFHTDILTDNIERGDVNFHKALFTEERTARQNLWHLMVELPASDQIRILHQDVEVKRKLNERMASGQIASPADVARPICRSSSMPLSQNSKRNQEGNETIKSTKLRIPQKVQVGAGGIPILKRVSSFPRNAEKGTKVCKPSRVQSKSPDLNNTKRQPLSPRKNASISNLPISRRANLRSNPLRENNSRKIGVASGKSDVTNKPPVSTGPIQRPCHQKNSSMKLWR